MVTSFNGRNLRVERRYKKIVISSPGSVPLHVYPLYTGGLPLLDESICHLMPFGLFNRFFFKFLMEKPVSKQVDPDQTPHYVAPDLGLHCLPIFQVIMLNLNVHVSIKHMILCLWFQTETTIFIHL